MKFLVLACFAAFAAASLIDEAAHVGIGHLPAWEDFKTEFGKSYETPDEEAKRFKIFVSNNIHIEQHNAEDELDGRHGYQLGVNEFADLTNDEFRKLYNGFRPRDKPSDAPTFLEPAGLTLPGSVDWRSSGYVTEVKNQGQCGSCWSFSATGSLEGQHFKKTGKLVSLSEQNLVDCSGKQGNEGCNGGLMDDAFTYIKVNGGIDTEASYPYTAKDGTCNFNKANVGATDTGFVDIPSKDESALQKAVASVGPVSVAIDASHLSFQFYRSGVYDPWLCSQTSLDHGVLAVGYGTSGSKDYWLVKNSWGATWGQKGYIWMVRNNNNKCGIATQASYPTV